MKKELLFVVDERKMGGVSVVLNDLVHLLNSNKYNIDILVLHNHGHMLENLPENTHLIFGTDYFDAIDLTMKEVLEQKSISLLMKKARIVVGLKTGWILHTLKKQRNQILCKEYDVEIAYKDGFCALFTACGKTKKKVHWLHCSYKTFNPNEKYPQLFQKILKEFQMIVGVSDNVVKEFNEIYHLENKTQVIPIVMDVQRILDLSKKEAVYPIKPDKLHIVLIGRCHPVKGYDRLFDVVKRLLYEDLTNNVDFTIFGDGPLFEHLKQRVVNEHLEELIMMKGNIDNPYAELKQYSMLLLPSYSEAFGTVISEAFILGVPVLSTQTSASLLALSDNRYGMICDNHEDAIYEALKEIIIDPKRIEIYRKNLIGFEYKNDVLLDKIEKLFDEEVIL